MMVELSGTKLLRGKLANLITSTGDDSFDSAFLSLLNRLFPVDLYTAFVFDCRSNLIGITGASRRRKELAQSLNEKFYLTHWRGDSTILGLRSGPSGQGLRYWRVPWTDIPSEQMKQELYREAGIVEKLSVRSDTPSGFVLWNIYRQNEFFSKNEFDYLRDWADLLSATITNHLKIARVSLPLPQEQSEHASFLRSSVERRGIHLSGRELSVCQGITSGATSKMIAADLGIKITSVLTYKRRIFEKFGVSAQRELVAILLNDILLRREDGSQSRPASH